MIQETRQNGIHRAISYLREGGCNLDERSAAPYVAIGAGIDNVAGTFKSKYFLPATLLTALVVTGVACNRTPTSTQPVANQETTSAPTQPAIEYPVNPAWVILCDKSDFGGRYLILPGPGIYDLDTLGFNDMTSSILNTGENEVLLLDKNNNPSRYNKSVRQLGGDNNSTRTVIVKRKGEEVVN